MRIAPDLSLEDLDKSMHIVLPGGSVERGFDAFRALAWHLPALWALAPLLYLPGVLPLGRAAYARIAERRRRCTHAECLQ
jgi:hypothetical protein